MNQFQSAFEQDIVSFNLLQQETFTKLEEQQRSLIEHTEKRLEEIRVTVDEKLQKTLKERLSQSSSSLPNNWKTNRKDWAKCKHRYKASAV